MPSWRSVSKSPWANKFQSPTVPQLRSGYVKAAVPVFDAARDMILNLGDQRESLAWHGVPWRWTLVYAPPAARRGSAAAATPFAYLIPDPERLQVCVPIACATLESLPLKRFKRSVREGLASARSVGGTMWPTWELPSKTALQEAAEFIRHKHHLATCPAKDRMAVGA